MLPGQIPRRSEQPTSSRSHRLECKVTMHDDVEMKSQLTYHNNSNTIRNNTHPASVSLTMAQQSPLPHSLPITSSPPSPIPSLHSPTNLSQASSDSHIFNGILHDRIALLVIDMQERERPLCERLLPKLMPLIELCQHPDHCETALVIFTQQGHPSDASEEEDGEMGRFWGRQNLIRIGTHDWELLHELKPMATRVLEKRHYDAFFSTTLHQILSFAGVSTVIISGVLTNLCCETTARSAAVHDYQVCFLEDGTACRDEELQKATMKNIQAGVGKVMKIQQAMKLVQEREEVVLREEGDGENRQHHHQQQRQHQLHVPSRNISSETEQKENLRRKEDGEEEMKI